MSVCQSDCDYDSVFAVSLSLCVFVSVSLAVCRPNRCQSVRRYINPHLVEVGLQLVAH